MSVQTVLRKIAMGSMILGTAVALALILFLPAEQIRGNLALRSCLKKARASGEKLLVQDLTPPHIVPDQSAAVGLLRAINQLSNGPAFPNNLPAAMKLVGPGKARVLCCQPDLRDEFSTNSWAALARQMEEVHAELTAVEAALRTNSFDFGVKYGPLHYREEQTNLMQIKSAARWFQAAVLNDLHRADRGAAVGHLQTMLLLSGTLKEERTRISQLVRISISRMAVATGWEALQATHWTDEELTQLQTPWRSLHLAEDMVRSLEMERAMNLATIHLLLEGDPVITQDVFGPSECGIGVSDFKPPTALDKFFSLNVVAPLWRTTWGGQAEAHFLEHYQRLVVAARQSLADKSAIPWKAGVAEASRWRASAGAYSLVRFFLTSMLLPWESDGLKALEMETEKEMLLTEIALTRYSLRHGQPAQSLKDLVPDFLPAVPVDWMDGQPLRYRRQGHGRFRLYSVGQDGRDDAGNPAPEPPRKGRTLWSGRDAVWPEAASAEEVAADEKAEAAEKAEFAKWYGPPPEAKR